MKHKGNEQQFDAANGLTLTYELDSVPVRVHDATGTEIFRLLLSGGPCGRSIIKLASGTYNRAVAEAVRELGDKLGIGEAEWERRTATRNPTLKWQK